MNKKYGIIGVIIIIILILTGIYFSGVLNNNNSSNEKGEVYLLAGAGFSKVGPELVKAFNEKYPNIKINVKYGGSGELFSILETQKQGDVFLPADYKYMGDAIKNDYIETNTVVNITKNIPTIVVEAGNPKNITSLADLGKSGVKVALGDPKVPAIGKASAQLLEKNNLTEKVTPNVEVYTSTVNQLLTYLVTGQVDAVIIWEDMTSWKENEGKIEVIKIPDNENIFSDIPVGVTKFAENKDASNKFAEFLYSENGKKVWEAWGFEIN
ncbi:MAG: molybdate ABC transporter substrate-binding protein [Methanobrevibacter sp.]|jgi:molybdate transport system substrate-binding protein|nr:molybdate ABC transporter substrate-binding protein [Candidatus Methanoflexus mossambicus]